FTVLCNPATTHSFPTRRSSDLKWPRRNSPVAEEKVDNQYNQDNRDDQRFLDLTDGAFDEHRLVHRDVKLDVIGNFVLDLLHSLVELVGDGDKVGAWQRHDGKSHHNHVAFPQYGLFILRTQDGLADIFQPDVAGG